MSDFNRMQTIKRRMFALRNGIVADSLRKGGTGYAMIFGLNLPQIREIADGLPEDRELAEELWADVRTRESLLLAPMLFPHDEMDEPTALRWISEVRQVEVADILCHRLLRHLPFAWSMAVRLSESPAAMDRYIAIRLMWNLLADHKNDILPFAEREILRNDPLTVRIANSLAEEVKFLAEEFEP